VLVNVAHADVDFTELGAQHLQCSAEVGRGAVEEGGERGEQQVSDAGSGA
jgi:hypothetical protein